MPAAEAARVARGGSTPQTFLLDEIARELEAALDDFSDSRAQTALDRLFGGFSVETAIADVVLPFLRRVGERWARGEITVAHEHFATTVVLGRLHALARRWDEGGGGASETLAAQTGCEFIAGDPIAAARALA